jgi:cellobiose-specific phosphotransferase system component IIA
MESFFRELLDCDPDDFDRIQTALIDVQIKLFDEIRHHMQQARRPLDDAIHAVDRTIARREAAGRRREFAKVFGLKERRRRKAD